MGVWFVLYLSKDQTIEDLSEIAKWLMGPGETADFIDIYCQIRAQTLRKSLEGLKDHLSKKSSGSAVSAGSYSPLIVSRALSRAHTVILPGCPLHNSHTPTAHPHCVLAKGHFPSKLVSMARLPLLPIQVPYPWMLGPIFCSFFIQPFHFLQRYSSSLNLDINSTHLLPYSLSDHEFIFVSLTLTR